jgi:hypothetical protein
MRHGNKFRGIFIIMKMLLDETSVGMLNYFRKRFIVEEDQQENIITLSQGDEGYDNFLSELGEQLTSVPIRLEYFRYTKANDNQGGIIEVSGYLQDQLNFVFKFGLDEGVFITCNNFQMKDSTPEALRILYTYYNGKFQESCKKIMEG